MTQCYLCESRFILTEDIYQKALLYGRMSIKRDIRWKDMVLTVYAKNSKDEDIVLCRNCLASALSRCAQEVTKTSIPMTAGIQFRGF